MKKTVLITLLFIASMNIYSQQFNWAKRIGGAGKDLAGSIAMDGSGNIYSCGSFSATVDFDPGPAVYTLTPAPGKQDAFLCKLDSSGNFIWVKRFGGVSADVAANSVTLDISGNIFLTGLFLGTADFDPGAATYTLSGSSDVFISKLDAMGNFLWTKQIGSGGSVDKGIDLVTDVSGNVYTTGMFNNTADFDPGPGTYTLAPTPSLGDVFISKLDASGNFVWARAFNGSSADEATAITLDGSGNVYTTGFFQGTVDFDPGLSVYNLTSAGSREIFISKLDASGNFLFAKQLGGTGSDKGERITIDGNGNIYTTGFFSATADFDPGPATYTLASTGNLDAFVSKLDASGNFLWAKKVGGTGNDTGYGISTDGINNVYIGGFFSLTVDFDPGIATYTLTSAGFDDIFISKLDPAGNFLWASQMGGTNYDQAYEIQVDLSGNVYATGFFNATADFNPGTGVYNLSSSGDYDIFINKLNSTCAVTASVVAGSIICNGATTTVTVTASGGMNPYTGTGTFTVPAGTYTYAVTDNTSCGATTSITVLQPAAIASSQSMTLCAGQSVAVGTSTYTANGTYTNVLISVNGCDSTVTTNLTVNPLPLISVNSGSICAGQSFTINPTGANTYTVQGGNNVVSPAASASYTVRGTSALGCVSAFVTSAVTVNPNPVIGVNSGTICSGQSFTINPTGAATYTIQGGSSAVSPGATTSYTISGTNTFGCISSSVATSTVSVLSAPIPTISVNSGTICSGQSFTIIPNGATTYTYSGGSSVVSPSSTTSYSVTGSNAQGCIGSNTAISEVQVNARPTVMAASTNSLICAGQTATLTASGASQYSWNTGQTTAVITVTPSITTGYTVTGTGANGCTNIASVTQSVSPCTGMEEMESNKGLMVYPNPSNGSFIVEAAIGSYISIHNVIGEEVFKGEIILEKQHIYIGEFANGMYVLTIRNAHGQHSIKLVKE